MHPAPFVICHCRPQPPVGWPESPEDRLNNEDGPREGTVGRSSEGVILRRAGVTVLSERGRRNGLWPAGSLSIGHQSGQLL